VRPPGSSREVDLSLSDISMAGDISADGSAIVFAEFGDIELERGAYLRPTRGGQALRLGLLLPLCLSPDGRRVAALVAGPSTQLVTYSPSTGEQHTVPLGPVDTVLWARWRGDEHLVILGAVPGRTPRLWLVGKDSSAPVPITPEGLFGHCHVSPDGTRVAFVDREGRCVLVPMDDPEAIQVVPGRYRDEQVCGFHAGGTELFLRTTALPIRIRRVNIATGGSVPHVEITPPALGLKGVDSFVLSSSGDAYAYSYGQELNRLYSMNGS
jgi:Tol biopolymer transport system component